MTMKCKKFPNFVGVIIYLIFVVACSSGGSSNGEQSNQNSSLKMSAPSTYPAGESFTAYVVINNNTIHDATNLFYTIESNNIGVIPLINPSGHDCASIAAGMSCIIAVNVPAGTHPGSFTVVARNANGLTAKTGSVNHSFITTSNVLSSKVISLVNIPDTNYSFFILPDDQTVISSNNESTVVYISVLTTANAAMFNNMKLVDESGNILDYQLLNNSLRTKSDNINSYQVVIPTGKSLQAIRVASYLNESAVCISPICSNSSVANVSFESIGILSIEPYYFVMSESYTKQQVIIRNQGTNIISGLQLPAPEAAFTISDNSCTSVLKPNASCQLTVNYQPMISGGQNSYVIRYNNGLYQASTLVTIPYIGLPVGILTIIPNSLSLTPIDRQQTVILKNTGSSSLTLTKLPTLTSPLQLITTSCSIGQVLAIHDNCSFTVGYLPTATSGSTLLTFYYNNGILNQNTNLVVNWQAYLQKLMFITSNKWGGNLVEKALEQGWNPNNSSPAQLAESGIYAANYLCQQSAHDFGYDAGGKNFVAIVNGGTALSNFSGYYVNVAESKVFLGSDASRINPIIYNMPSLINAVLIQGQNAESDINKNKDHWYWTAATPDGSFLIESGYTGSMDKPGDEMSNFNGIINASCVGFTDDGNWPVWGIVGRQSKLTDLRWWDYNNNRSGSYNTDPIGTKNTFSAVIYAKTHATENALWCAQQ